MFVFTYKRSQTITCNIVNLHLELIPNVSRLKKCRTIAYTWLGVSTHTIRLATPNQFMIHMVKCEEVRVLGSSSEGGRFVRDSERKVCEELEQELFYSSEMVGTVDAVYGLEQIC